MKLYLKTDIQRKKFAGFTLIELMITTGILVVAIISLLFVFISTSLLSQASHNKIIAITDAQYVLEKLKNTDYGNIASSTETNFTNLNNEIININVNEANNVKTVIANVTWTERQAQRSFALTTQFAN